MTQPPALSSRPRVLALVLSTPVLLVSLWFAWGSTFVAVKIALRSAGPESLALLRAVIAAVVVLTILGVRRAITPSPYVRAPRTVHVAGLVLGLVNVAAMQILVNVGMTDAAAGVSALILYTQPMFVVVIARVVLKERLTTRKLVGLTVGWLGVVGLVAGELDLGRVHPGSVGLLLGAAATWAVGTILYKVLAPEPAHSTRLLLLQNVYGLAPLAVAAVIARSPVEPNLELLGAALWAGGFGSVAGFGLQYLLLRRGEAGVVSALAFGAPIIGAALSVLILDEPVHAGLLAGCVGVAVGTWLLATYVRGAMRSSAPDCPPIGPDS